jgi:hypothetical protein
MLKSQVLLASVVLVEDRAPRSTRWSTRQACRCASCCRRASRRDLIADRGYDARAVVDLVESRSRAHILTCRDRKVQRSVDPALYRQRNPAGQGSRPGISHRLQRDLPCSVSLVVGLMLTTFHLINVNVTERRHCLPRQQYALGRNVPHDSTARVLDATGTEDDDRRFDEIRRGNSVR